MTQPIEPSPVPTQVTANLVNLSDGSAAVLFILDDVTGRKISFFPPDNAVQIGEMLIEIGRRGKTGLIVPGSINLTELDDSILNPRP